MKSQGAESPEPNMLIGQYEPEIQRLIHIWDTGMDPATRELSRLSS
jgi:hypothetical protein